VALAACAMCRSTLSFTNGDAVCGRRWAFMRWHEPDELSCLVLAPCRRRERCLRLLSFCVISEARGRSQVMWEWSRICVLESVRLARQYDLLTRLGPSDAAFDEKPPVGLEQDRGLLSALPSERYFLFASTSNRNRKRNDRPRPVATHRPGMTDEGDRERLRTSIDGLRNPLQASGLPRRPFVRRAPGCSRVSRDSAGLS
jgi:hypothetical protein